MFLFDSAISLNINFSMVLLIQICSLAPRIQLELVVLVQLHVIITIAHVKWSIFESVQLEFNVRSICLCDIQVIKQAVIIERIHFHRKLYSGFVFCWFISSCFFSLYHFFVELYIFQTTPQAYMVFLVENWWSQYQRISWIWWRRPRQNQPKKKLHTADILSEMRTQHLFVHLILMRLKREPLLWFPYNIW